MERDRWLLVLFVLVQVAIPTYGLLIRWAGGSASARWSWHMFSTLQ